MKVLAWLMPRRYSRAVEEGSDSYGLLSSWRLGVGERCLGLFLLLRCRLSGNGPFKAGDNVPGEKRVSSVGGTIMWLEWSIVKSMAFQLLFRMLRKASGSHSRFPLEPS